MEPPQTVRSPPEGIEYHGIVRPEGDVGVQKLFPGCPGEAQERGKSFRSVELLSVMKGSRHRQPHGWEEGRHTVRSCVGP